MTYWLIAINVAVFIAGFLADLLSPGWLARLGQFSFDAAISHLQIWRFITFQFLHATLMHIVFNMLTLYYFGAIVERYLGRARYLAFYLFCGMAGAAAYLLLVAAHFVSPTTPLVGASAGIFGVLIAAATRVAPNVKVRLLIPPVTLKLQTLAWAMVGLAVFSLLYGAEHPGGAMAHLGGAGLGYLLIQRPQLLNIFARWPRSRKRSR